MKGKILTVSDIKFILKKSLLLGYMKTKALGWSDLQTMELTFERHPGGY